jgi:hypothetical protein
LNRLLKNPPPLSSLSAVKDFALRIGSKMLRGRFFAEFTLSEANGLRITALKRFSAAY